MHQAGLGQLREQCYNGLLLGFESFWCMARVLCGRLDLLPPVWVHQQIKPLCILPRQTHWSFSLHGRGRKAVIVWSWLPICSQRLLHSTVAFLQRQYTNHSSSGSGAPDSSTDGVSDFCSDLGPNFCCGLCLPVICSTVQ